MRNLLLTALLLSSLLYAQSERGTISGQVTDSSGAAIAGAVVTVSNKATNVPANLTTNSAGEYSAPNLSPGDYRIEVSASGFKRFVQDTITLAAGSTVRRDATLQLGQVNEVVEVSANAIQLQTDNAKVSTTVQNQLVDELPLVVGGALRSPFTLVAITPESKGTGQSLSLGGGQAAAWDATLDGISIATNRSSDATEIAYTAPSVEAITEFSVDTNGFKAEYGQAGGGVMTFVSKSGTNQFHGVAYDFLRNDALDARGFFAAQRGVYKQNDFGATLGGPVVIPKLYNGRNKTFFFMAYEGFRNRVGQNGVIKSVPTPEMYQGDFSNLVDASGKRIIIYDPATTRANPSGSGFIRDPFPNNIIPTNRFSAVSKSILPFAQSVAPNRPGLVPGTIGYISNNYITNGGATTSPTDKGSLKLDQNIGAKHHLGFLVNITKFSSEPIGNQPPGLPYPLYDGTASVYDASAYRLTYDWTVTPTVLNHFNIGGNLLRKNSYSTNSGLNWKDKVCIKNAVDCNTNFPVIAFTEFSGWGTSTYNGTEQPMWTLKDDVSLIRGRHSIKAGFAFDNQRANGFGQQNISGRAAFSYQGTSVPGATSPTSGSSFASFLLGDAGSGNTETIRSVTQMYNYYGFYVQDDWRVSNKLTVNLGLRYEFTQPPVEVDNQFSDFTPDLPNPAVNGYPGALRFAGDGPGRTGTRSLVPSWYGGWGPRLGVAYSLNDKTTIRAGAGRSFSRVTVVQGSGHYAGFIGQYNFDTPDQGITPAFNWDRGLPAYPLPPLIDPTFANNQNVDFWQLSDVTRAPESINWTFSMQRQLSGNTVLEAMYNGAAGSHLQTGLINLNQVPTNVWNNLVNQCGATGARNLLNAKIGSAAATVACNVSIPVPYANFLDPNVQRSQTVAQALRPFPQYLNIVTGVQNGDKSGHSSYHALVLKATRRFSAGLTFQYNYTFSKLLTDSDTYFANAAAAQDQYNRRLEKSIGQYDQTHALKFSTLYELPFGPGKRWLSHGFVGKALGGWRLGAIQTYTSGYPIALARNNPLPIFNGITRPTITSYEGWRAATKGDKFDPNVDLFLDKSVFPVQPTGFGNATRYNPKLRNFPNLNENISLGKSFAFTETKRLDFRWEAFNLFNRTVFGGPVTNLDSATFGKVTTQSNDPRQMQVALKLYF